jgi:hypothetical protein
MAVTAAEFERSRTWILEFAAAVLPGMAWRDVGEERTFEHTGGLSINRRNGLWFCHAPGAAVARRSSSLRGFMPRIAVAAAGCMILAAGGEALQGLQLSV